MTQCNGQNRGESGLYITLSEFETKLRAVAEHHDSNIEGIDVFELITKAGLDAEVEQSVSYPLELELGETVRAVMA